MSKYKVIIDTHCQWCLDNEEIALKAKTVINYFKINSSKLKIEYSNNIKNGNNNGRGFRGIMRVKDFDLPF